MRMVRRCCPSSLAMHLPTLLLLPWPPPVQPFNRFQLILHETVPAKRFRATGLSQVCSPERQQCHACGNATVPLGNQPEMSRNHLLTGADPCRGCLPLPCNRCPTCLHLLPVTPPARAGHSPLHGTLQNRLLGSLVGPSGSRWRSRLLAFFFAFFFYFWVLFLLPFPPCPQPRVLWVFFFFFFFLVFFLPRKT